MKEYIEIGDWKCELKKFDYEIPKGIIIIDHIESVWGDEVTNYLNKSDYDYIISKSKASNIKTGTLNNKFRWTIPQKVKMFKRQQKLKELGI